MDNKLNTLIKKQKSKTIQNPLSSSNGDIQQVAAKVIELPSNSVCETKVQVLNATSPVLTLVNKSGDFLSVGDYVWIHYKGNIRSGYIAIKNGLSNGLVGKAVNPKSSGGNISGEIFNDYYQNTASGWFSHAEGDSTKATSNAAHSEGGGTTASGDYSHAEGKSTSTSGYGSHAEGVGTSTSGYGSHAEGGGTQAISMYSHAEGNGCRASGDISHAEGSGCRAEGTGSHAEGGGTQAVGVMSHTEGGGCNASGDSSHAEGAGTSTSGYGSHAEGGGTQAISMYSHAEGYLTRSVGDYSHSEGYGTIAKGQCSHVQGRYNIGDTTDTYVDIIGWGQTDTTRSNIFTVSTTGNVSASGTFSSGGADYAEWWEWQDGNLNNEDRRGLFVTLNGDKLVKANNNDWILGIVSATPSVIGDNYDDEWQGKYLRDIFGEYIYEEIQTEIKDEIQNTAKIITEKVRKLNPDYDDTKPYVSRNNRKEWSCIGTGGKIIMVDDGTCEVDGWCKPNANGAGIATKSDTETKYRVIKRIDKTHIKIWIW